MLRKRLTKSQIEKLKKHHEDGMSFMDIAIKKKISLWTVKYHLDLKYKGSVMKNNIKRNRKIAKKKTEAKE